MGLELVQWDWTLRGGTLDDESHCPAAVAAVQGLDLLRAVGIDFTARLPSRCCGGELHGCRHCLNCGVKSGGEAAQNRSRHRFSE
ncbi:hypothetical protein IscW_ISCW006238 [Ixodes scapularis]|uniref:Uncharacterized protein n=1 Tax=Ixodes scapularis TaxID=6945 RepID=B7PNF4_IXOSC|nr:hypothetical protein IscW_ISCW006238 [Ixodes scapularis]|eukprot:XP_002435302.1 hypothetical protein IscW_ISCW006238 [Ixodes scapularis]